MSKVKSPESLAELVAEGLYARDRTAQSLGIVIDEVSPGYAKLRMAVREDMVNGHDICHGGIIFTLADAAFGYACNSRNIVTLGQHCSITYLTPAKRGDILIAVAREHTKLGRTAITDATVNRHDGHPIAVFRGQSVTTKGEVITGLEDKT